MGETPVQQHSAASLNNVDFRLATAVDAALLWEWVRDAEVRKASFGPGPASWEEHVGWLRRKLADPNCLLWIATVEGQPAGQLRIDLAGQGGELSVSVASAYRGRGLGRAIVTQAVHLALSRPGIHYVDALVKADNLRSIRMFRDCAFADMGETVVAGHRAVRFRKGSATEEAPRE